MCSREGERNNVDELEVFQTPVAARTTIDSHFHTSPHSQYRIL